MYIYYKVINIKIKNLEKNNFKLKKNLNNDGNKKH